MPIIITDDEKPTYVAKPDMRFATTFLSYKFRDYGVIGESLQDKATGEIYTKREDGRTVSFFQNKKIYEDLCLKLRIMINNNPGFMWPSHDDDREYFCGVNYDSLTMFSEKRLDILTTDVVFPNDEDNLSTQFKFNISPKSNGFFICPTSRDPDKASINFLTSKYNEMFENYSGNNPTYRLEHEKFIAIDRWKWSNAVIHYTVRVSDNDGHVKVYTMQDYIRVNELCVVYIPIESMNIDFPDGYTDILITIKGIQYYKIHFMVDHYNEFDQNFKDAYNHLLYPDNEIYIDWYEVYTFVQDIDDMLFLGNEFVVALLDVPYFREYLIKMGAILKGGGIILSKDMPDDGVWVTNVAWGERVSDRYAGGLKVDHNSTTDVRKMEAMLAGVGYIPAEIYTDPTALDDFYISEESNAASYTVDDIRTLVGNIMDAAENQADNLIVRAEDDDQLTLAKAKVSGEGMVLGTVFTTESDDESED